MSDQLDSFHWEVFLDVLHLGNVYEIRGALGVYMRSRFTVLFISSNVTCEWAQDTSGDFIRNLKEGDMFTNEPRNPIILYGQVIIPQQLNLFHKQENT